MEDLSSVIHLVGQAIDVAAHVPCGDYFGNPGEADLSAEVIGSAMLYLKEHPDVSIEAALQYGLGEWLK